MSRALWKSKSRCICKRYVARGASLAKEGGSSFGSDILAPDANFAADATIRARRQRFVAFRRVFPRGPGGGYFWNDGDSHRRVRSQLSPPLISTCSKYPGRLRIASYNAMLRPGFPSSSVLRAVVWIANGTFRARANSILAGRFVVGDRAGDFPSVVATA